MNFRTDIEGGINAVELPLQNGLNPIVFQRQDEITNLSSGELNQYAGTYALMGQKIKIFVLNGELKLTVPGQPEYLLLNIGENHFKIDGVNGFKVLFEPDTNGAINNVVFQQPNGNFRAERTN